MLAFWGVVIVGVILLIRSVGGAQGGLWHETPQRRFRRPLYTADRRFQFPVETAALPTFSEPALGTVASPHRDGELRSGMYRSKMIGGPERRRAW